MAEIRKVDISELQGLVALYKEAFPTHNIFTRDDDEILKYLTQMHEKLRNDKKGIIGSILIAEFNSEIVGSCMLCPEEINDKMHSRWKIKHLAVAKNCQGIGIGKSLVEAALRQIKDLMIKEEISSAKIEVAVSQEKTEKVQENAAEFYIKLGFRKEGILSDHFRLDEDTIILGMTLKR